MGYIYKVTSKTTNKVYIGQTIRTLEERKNEHLKRAKAKSANKENKYDFYKALLELGTNDFIWEVIEECPNEKLNEREIYQIAYYNSYLDKTKGYNMTPGGQGHPLSQETKNKISQANKGKVRTIEQRQHLSEVKKNMHFHHTEETKNLMSEQRKGRKLNLSKEEHARRQAPKSEEFKRLISEKMKNKTLSEETRKKISESRKAIIDIYTSNDLHFTSWEEIYNYLIENNLTSAKEVSICRNTIYTVLDKMECNCYGLKWKSSPFLNEEEKVIVSKVCSEQTKQKISQANKKKNEIVICYNDQNKLIFNSRQEAYDYLIKNNLMPEKVKYSNFSSKIGEASKTKQRHRNFYWEIKQKDVETIEKS